MLIKYIPKMNKYALGAAVAACPFNAYLLAFIY